MDQYDEFKAMIDAYLDKHKKTAKYVFLYTPATLERYFVKKLHTKNLH